MFKARIRLNDTTRISEVYLKAVDVDNSANNAASANLIGGMSNNTWYNASLTFNNTGWTGNGIGLCVSFRGTTTAANVGQTLIGIQFIIYSA